MSTDSTASATPTSEPPPLRSVHTNNFGPLLGELGLSLLVTTYQAGKLVVLRQNEEGTLTTHFRAFPRPMGLAVAGDRLALGTALEVSEFHNLPAVARQQVSRTRMPLVALSSWARAKMKRGSSRLSMLPVLSGV
jgi:hypothetical protein